MKINKIIKKFNDYLADRLSYILSIMTTFYVITLLVTLPLFYSTPNSLVGWSQYLCSVIFQGIALPVLGYTARKSADKSDKMMKEMYRMTKEIDAIVKHLDIKQDEILKMEEEERKKNDTSKFEF